MHKCRCVGLTNILARPYMTFLGILRVMDLTISHFEITKSLTITYFVGIS